MGVRAVVELRPGGFGQIGEVDARAPVPVEPLLYQGRGVLGQQGQLGVLGRVRLRNVEVGLQVWEGGQEHLLTFPLLHPEYVERSFRTFYSSYLCEVVGLLGDIEMGDVLS